MHHASADSAACRVKLLYKSVLISTVQQWKLSANAVSPVVGVRALPASTDTRARARMHAHAHTHTRRCSVLVMAPTLIAK